MFQRVTQDEDMKISFKCSVAPLLTGFPRAWAILEWHCPQYDLNVLIHWLSVFERHCLQFTDSSFKHCLIADLSTACFSFSRSTVLPPAAQLFKECRGLQCHFYQRFCILNQCSSVFDNLPCFGINSHISKIMSIQSLVCWNEIRDVLFENLLKIKLFDQRPNTRYSKYTVLWLSCILKTEIDPM